MEEYVVLGKKHIKTSKGNDFYQYYFKRPFNAYESENSIECLGMAVESEACSIDFAVQPGDVVILGYSKGFQDKATLTNITVVEKKNK